MQSEKPIKSQAHTSMVAQSFREGAHAGAQWGDTLAPFVVLGFMMFWGWVLFRIFRWFLRMTR